MGFADEMFGQNDFSDEFRTLKSSEQKVLKAIERAIRTPARVPGVLMMTALACPTAARYGLPLTGCIGVQERARLSMLRLQQCGSCRLFLHPRLPHPSLLAAASVASFSHGIRRGSSCTSGFERAHYFGAAGVHHPSYALVVGCCGWPGSLCAVPWWQ